MGIIVQVNLHEREFWITADAGQGFPLGPHPRLEREDVRGLPQLRHQSAYLVPRTSWCEDGEHGRLFLRHYHDRNEKGGFVLSGWVDIGHSTVRFRNDTMDANGTDADFEDLRRRVGRVDAAAKAGRSSEWLEADNAAAAKGAYDPVTL